VSNLYGGVTDPVPMVFDNKIIVCECFKCRVRGYARHRRSNHTKPPCKTCQGSGTELFLDLRINDFEGFMTVWDDNGKVNIRKIGAWER